MGDEKVITDYGQRGLHADLEAREEEHDLWLITMSDVMTLLLIFFLVWFIVKTQQKFNSTTQVDVKNSIEPLRNPTDKFNRYAILPQFRSSGETVIELLEGTGFDSGSAELTPQGLTTLKRIAPHILENIGSWKVIIIGHTDATPVGGGPWDSNLSLSMARATAVWRALLSLGVPPTRMEVQALGSLQPVVDNDTPEHRRLNRRVEILLRPVAGIQQLPQA